MKSTETGRCVVICAGELAEQTAVRAAVTSKDFVIAADGGYLHAQRLGIHPQLIVGDFDSAPRPDFDGDIEVYPPIKDDTDCMIAVEAGWQRGYREFIILGGTGGRLDHTMANIQTLCWLVEHDAQGIMMDDNHDIRVLGPGRWEFSRFEGYFSTFALLGGHMTVSEEGMYYPLDHHVMTAGVPLGVSNRITAPTAVFTVHSGMALVILYYENDGGTKHVQ